MPLFGESVGEGRTEDGVKPVSCEDTRPESLPSGFQSAREALGGHGTLGGGQFQARDAYEVVDGHRGEDFGGDAAYPSESGLRLAGRGLHPAEDPPPASAGPG